MAHLECLYLLTKFETPIAKLMMMMTMTMVLIEVETAMAIETSSGDMVVGVAIGVGSGVAVVVVESDSEEEIIQFAAFISFTCNIMWIHVYYEILSIENSL